MRSALRSGVATALLLAVVGAVAIATSASGSGDSRSFVLHLVAREVSSVYLPVNPDDVSQGDEFHFTNDLFRRSGGAENKVGEDGGLCTVNSASQRTDRRPTTAPARTISPGRAECPPKGW